MLSPSHRKRSTRARKRVVRRRREHGAVMLLIMIIIIITTAAAAVSVENTTAEVRASGRELMTLQARYAAEASLMTALAYLDKNRGSIDWEALARAGAPDMRRASAGHTITSTLLAARFGPENFNLDPMDVLPVSNADIAAPIPDPIGSFGPNQVYEAQRYEVDLTDCYMTRCPPGNDDSAQCRYCVLTLRERIVLTGGGGWPLNWGTGDSQDRAGAAHNTRATVITPAVTSTGDPDGDG